MQHPHSTKWQSWRLDNNHNNTTILSLLVQENTSAPFMPFNERYPELRKFFKTAQAYPDMIWQKMAGE